MHCSFALLRAVLSLRDKSSANLDPDGDWIDWRPAHEVLNEADFYSSTVESGLNGSSTSLGQVPQYSCMYPQKHFVGGMVFG